MKMKQESRRKIRRQVATFGVALSGLAAADAAQGAIVSLTPNPGTVPFATGSNLVTLGPPGLSFQQFNNPGGKSFGYTFGSGSSAIAGFRSTTVGNVISTGLAFNPYIILSPSETGTGTFAFLTNADQVGWFRMNFGGSGGAITYLGAAFESTPGVPIVAGAVPEPATVGLFGLGVLALGAAGVRRMRKRRASA